MKVAFSGTHSFDLSDQSNEGLIKRLKVTDTIGGVILNNSVDEFISGAAHGIDTHAAASAYALSPARTKHRIVVPNRDHNFAFVEVISKWPGFITIENMPEGTDNLDRNDRMIELADKLIAFPKTANEEKRSGTWATIRRGWKKGIAVEIHPLNEL